MGKINKRGVIRIIEATVALLIIFSVLLIISKPTAVEDNSLNDVITPLLKEISKNNTIRESIIKSSDVSKIKKTEMDMMVFLKNRISRPDLNYSVKICNASELCSLENFPKSRDGNMYSEERVISTYLKNNDVNIEFKKVKIFLWRK